MAKARAEIELTASTSRLAAGLNAARRQFQSFAGSIARGVGGAMSFGLSKLKPGETMKRAAGNFGGDMMTRGFDAVVGAATDVQNFERSLVRFQIAAGKTPEQMNAIRSSIRDASRETAIGSKEIQAGGNAYLALTGDVTGTIGAMRSFSRIAQASGASVEDVASATAALKIAMKLDVAKDAEAAFSGLIAQGKVGAVEIKDFAGELAELAPQFAQFKGATGLAGIREMGGIFQVIRNGAGSASGAATQFKAVMAQLVDPMNVKLLKQIGINVFDSKNQLRGFTDIATELAANKFMQDPKKVAKIFGREEARAALRSLMGNVAALKQMEQAGLNVTAVNEDLATFLASDAGRVDKAMNNIKEAIAEAFTPERIQGFANTLESLAGKVGPIVDLIGKIGDKLAGIRNLGQWVENWQEGAEGMGAYGGAADQIRDEAVLRAGGANLPRIGPGGSIIEGDEIGGHAKAARIVEARGNMNRRAAFRGARDELTKLSGGINGGPNEEAIRRAVMIAKSGSSQETTGETFFRGDEARRKAGEMYLRAAGVSPERQAEIFSKEMERIFASGNDKIVAAIQQIADGKRMVPALFKIGEDAVQRAEQGAPRARRRPAR